MDSVVHTRKAGEEHNEKMELDPNKQTELFEVPAHAGVPDRSDTLNDFKPVSFSSLLSPVIFKTIYYVYMYRLCIFNEFQF